MSAIHFVWITAGGLTGTFLAGLLILILNLVSLPSWVYPLIGGTFSIIGMVLGMIFAFWWEARRPYPDYHIHLGRERPR